MCEDCQTFSRMHSSFLLNRQLDCVSHSSLKSDGHVLEYTRSGVMCQPKAQYITPFQILDPLPRRQAMNFEVLYTAETCHDRAVQLYDYLRVIYYYTLSQTKVPRVKYYM